MQGGLLGAGGPLDAGTVFGQEYENATLEPVFMLMEGFGKVSPAYSYCTLAQGQES